MSVQDAKVLVVGAGGIGCELIKDLVLANFRNIKIIDLDTIDFSNLNRQFLFHKKHVGKSKAKVAKESAELINSDVNIEAYHDSIMKPEYGMEFFKTFDVVMNALDNRAARSHVNRLCLAADVPLIESGSSGYLGQVTPIFKGLSECYECQPKAGQKTYPGCTIRNTPSEPIHCIVWAKHLFNQLFGEADIDEEVSPDSTDPELSEGKVQLETNVGGNVERVSTRQWAESNGYDHEKLFNKLFFDDLVYLCEMSDLWKKRRAPTPIRWNSVSQHIPGTSTVQNGNSANASRELRIWPIAECADIFHSSVVSLKKRLETQNSHLIWDKDEPDCMDFVVACANIRSYCFGITPKSRFDIKSMAGNIIPAIATTNAVIAGLIVLQALKILRGEKKKCKAVYLNRAPTLNKKLIIPQVLDSPNPKCYVCSAKSELCVVLNVEKTSLKAFEEKVLKGHLNMSAPDVEIEGLGAVILSSEEGETEDNMLKTLSELKVINGIRLVCDDFNQNFKVILNVIHKEHLEDDKEFQVIGEVPEATPEDMPSTSNGSSGGSMTSASQDVDDDDDDCAIVDDDTDDDIVIMEEAPVERGLKRRSDTDLNGSDTKRQRVD